MTPRCTPMLKEVLQTVRLAAGLAVSLRRLRRRVSGCRACQSKDHCLRLDVYRREVEAALMQVSLEWDLEGD